MASHFCITPFESGSEYGADGYEDCQLIVKSIRKAERKNIKAEAYCLLSRMDMCEPDQEEVKLAVMIVGRLGPD